MDAIVGTFLRGPGNPHPATTQVFAVARSGDTAGARSVVRALASGRAGVPEMSLVSPETDATSAEILGRLCGPPVLTPRVSRRRRPSPRKSTAPIRFPRNTSSPLADGIHRGAFSARSTPQHRPRLPSRNQHAMPLSNRLSALALLLLTSPLACSGHSPASGTELPPACNAFVAKYESCIKASVPSLPAVAKQRAAQTRAALEKEV